MNEDLIASLHPPRLPEAFATLGAMDLLAAFGIGLLLAVLILSLAGPLLQRRPRRIGLSAQIAETKSLPPQDRLLALTRLLSTRGGAIPDEMKDLLYRGAPPPSDSELAAVEALIRRGRR